MRCQFKIVLLLLVLTEFCASEFDHLVKRETHSRKRRYLNFPEGSSAILQVSLSNGLVWEKTNTPLPRWNILIVWDLGFRLPNNSRLIFSERRPHKNEYEGCNTENCYILHRRERRELYSTIEGMLDSHGVSGRSCVLRALCEAQKLTKPGRSLLEDILHVVFTIPEGSGDEFEADGYDEAKCSSFCDSLRKYCPISILDYLLL